METFDEQAFSGLVHRGLVLYLILDLLALERDLSEHGHPQHRTLASHLPFKTRGKANAACAAQRRAKYGRHAQFRSRF